ncbi:MAG: hypothetical protein Kow0029_30960 [Candidatus Rifleibacteriota bacterium]
MAEYFTIAEVSKITGLATHTIRYYEKQFPAIFDVERSRGGHRMYRERHLRALKEVLRLLKDEKMSIKDARKLLCEPDIEEVEPHIEKDFNANSNNVAEIRRSLVQVLEKLDRLCQSNERRDSILEAFLQRTSSCENRELLEQIARCRNETRETMKLYRSLMNRWKN